MDAVGKDCQVPFLERYCVVVEPSNATEVLATLLEPDASVTTSLSPFAMAMSVVYNAPSLVMLPCAWLESALPVRSDVRAKVPVESSASAGSQ